MTHWNLIVCEELCNEQAEVWCEMLQCKEEVEFRVENDDAYCIEVLNNSYRYMELLERYKIIVTALKNFPRGMVEYCTL